MMALQSMTSQSSLRSAEPALSNITNGSTPAHAARGVQSLDDISGQILTLTNIATSLQKEMNALSRRSRDNATDLLSLKEATTTRDEDIRKNLRELMGSISETSSRISSGGLFLDNKPHNMSPPLGRSYHLPRIPSPKSFADSIERGSVSTPSLTGGASADAAASLVLLEKIVREMGTKEGQDNLIDHLTEMSQKLSGMASSAKVDEILTFVRAQNLSTGAVVTRDFAPGSQGELSGPMTKRVEHLLRNGEGRRSSAPAERGAELLNDDLINIIRSVKDSVAQGGGLTAEVKALVRELRGEVLGMGRELGKRLENVSRHDLEAADAPSKDEVSRVIDEGLEQMKDQLNHVLREHRRQSAGSAASNKTLVDYQEIYNAMRAALRDNEASREDMPDLSREDVIEAVREAWENYKPEIEVQQLGLERDEVLACLQEGLQEYAPQSDRSVGATREEVFQAVVEGLKHFVPPQMDTSATLSRDEIIEAVRDCLEEFEFPVAASAIGNDVTRDDMARAVQDGLAGLSLGAAGGAAMSLATGDNGEVLSRLQDLLEYMKLEFRAVSEEAKENVAANGRDTEQLLDAIKDGLENLRASIEGYVDRSTGVDSQEQFLDDLTKSVEEFKEDLHKLVAEVTENSREQLSTELEKLRDMVNTSMVPATPQAAGNNQEVLEALQSGVNTLRQEFHRPRTETGEIIDALHEGLKELREAIDRVGNKPVDLTANDEILDALKSGLDSVKSDIETLRDSSSDRAVTALHNVAPENAVVPADMVKQDDIKNLEVLISSLRIKVEAMEPDTESVHRDDLTRLEEMLSNVQQGVEEIKTREPPAPAPKETSANNESASGADAATRDDVVAIETILRNTKDRLDDLIDGEQAVRKDQIDAVETIILESKESLSSISEKMESMPDKADVAAMGTLIAAITAGIEEMKEKTKTEEEDAEKVSKTDIEAVETAVLEMKTTLDAMALTDLATLSQKEDVTKIETTLAEAKEALDTHVEATAKALEDRQAELVGVGERVLEVKSFLEEFQEIVKGKLEEDSNGIESVGKLLETMGEKIDKNENVGQDLKDLLETMKSEFENSRDVVAGAKLESDEKLQETTETISTKIDDKIAEVIAKYEELQAGLDEKTTAGEARGIETAAAVADTKTVAEELRTLVDTLGSTVTESLEKMEEASKTVFSKVEDLSTKTDDIHTVEKSEHQQTRESIQAAVIAVEGLQGDMKEYQPQILEAVKDVLLLVGQHFEHSKSSATDIQDKLVEVKPTEQEMQNMLPAPEKYDDSQVREQLAALANQRYDDSELREKLDRLVEQKYDDTPVREKLEAITEHNTTAAEAFSQLDKVHESVLKTASEISEFLASQTQRITDEQVDREKTLQEANIELERKLAQQTQVEISIASLREEEERLRASVLGLRTEQESLIRQKTRLTGDVSSLETAMRLRKEELADMESRAEGLERRILEGVMDHSRVLLMSKSVKGGDAMNRKRVKKSTNPDAEAMRSTPARPAVNMALSSAKRNLAPPAQNGTARRIVSLSQINNNVSTGGVKRSQSVRTPAATSRALRKRSWGGDMAKGFHDLEDDKENKNARLLRDTVEEVEEPATPEPQSQQLYHNDIPGDDTTALGSELSMDGDNDDAVSDAGTLRRSSRGTTIMTGRTSDMYTESESGSYLSYDDNASDWTESAVGVTPAEGNEVVVYGQ
jgi:DNA repair exonuclease SbcCD ATPase subunit